VVSRRLLVILDSDCFKIKDVGCVVSKNSEFKFKSFFTHRDEILQAFEKLELVKMDAACKPKFDDRGCFYFVT